MKYLNMDEIRAIELSLLNELDKICEKENFQYSLAGGTLLGAVRHGGFIPWDDDIDVLMPREDYEKFIDYCYVNQTNFDLFSCRSNDEYEGTISIISDRSTILVDPFGHIGNYKKGIVIDIFPIDGAGNTVEEAKNIYSKTRFKREMLNACAWKYFSFSKTRSIIYEPIRFLFFIISRLFNPNKLAKQLDALYKNNRLQDYKYATCFSGSYREKEILRREVYTELCKMMFEGREYRCMVHFDEYLTKLYGDYMKLPPKDKQISHHVYRAYWRE